VADGKNGQSLLKQCGFTIRLVIVAYSALLLIAGIWSGVSQGTCILLILQLAVFFGLVSPVPRRGRMPRKIVAVVALMALLVTVLLSARREVMLPRYGELFSVPGTHAFSIGDIVPERDILAVAARFLPLIGGLSLSEASGLFSAISALTDSMEQERNRYTSPLVPSLIGASLLFDSKVLALSPQEGGSTNRAVVFLHGTGGNIGLVCWIISKAAVSINADTYCPSLGVLGMWGSDRGREIVRELLTNLRARGKTEIYLVGISAGAVGAAELVPEFESQLRGVALLNGAHPGVKDTKLPVLFLYGKQDERFPPSLLGWIARQSARSNPGVTVAEQDGDHLMAIKRQDTLHEILLAWLRQVSSGSNHDAIQPESRQSRAGQRRIAF